MEASHILWALIQIISDPSTIQARLAGALEYVMWDSVSAAAEKSLTPDLVEEFKAITRRAAVCSTLDDEEASKTARQLLLVFWSATTSQPPPQPVVADPQKPRVAPKRTKRKKGKG